MREINEIVDDMIIFLRDYQKTGELTLEAWGAIDNLILEYYYYILAKRGNENEKQI